MMEQKKRCKWCNTKNPLYIDYHDNEWCVPNFNEKYLYEMLILESFQAGLSWECVLKKEKRSERLTMILISKRLSATVTKRQKNYLIIKKLSETN